ncbi:MAG TPA: hypothetical protein VFA75_21400 [Nevskia sp.]|nr:hypothetical protein [Nevskia sp.]
MAAHYAYWAEAALAHFEEGCWLRQEALHSEREICVHYARSARAALNALLVSCSMAPSQGSTNLLSAVVILRQVGHLWGRAERKALSHARLLSRVLILDLADAGADYVVRDLFGQDDVVQCEVAARFFLGIVCKRFLGLDAEQTQLRFDPLRQPPMTDTQLWIRRRIHLTKSKRPPHPQP